MHFFATAFVLFTAVGVFASPVARGLEGDPLQQALSSFLGVISPETQRYGPEPTAYKVCFLP